MIKRTHAHDRRRYDDVEVAALHAGREEEGRDDDERAADDTLMEREVRYQRYFRLITFPCR